MRMIPATPHGTRSRAEKRIFDLLRVALNADFEPYTAFHSLNLTRHAYKRFGEIDFLICGPSGIYVLEVKGGGIACKEGVWTYTNRYGETAQSKEGPFKQAESALFGLTSKLREKLTPDWMDRLHVGYAVVFPDCRWKMVGAEWDRQIVADAGDLMHFEQWLKGVFRYWRQKDHRTRRADETVLRAMTSYLRPEFEAAMPLHIQTAQVEKQVAGLTKSQMNLLDVVEANPRIMCSGGAGTGKTFLAVELARRWTAGGAKIALVCRSPWLRSFLESRFPVPRLSVASMEGVATAARRAGIERFDAVIIDEGQDLLEYGILDALNHYLTGGFENGRWCFFYDVNNQAGLFGPVDEAAIAFLERCRPARVSLQVNCRNTRIILEKVKALLGADMGVQGVGEGPPIRQKTVISKPDAARVLAAEIHYYLEQGGLSQSALTILSPQPFARSCAALLDQSVLKHLTVLDEYALRNFPPVNISFSEIASFKGLENQAVIVIDLPPPTATGGPLPQHYTAMSRPRAALSLIFQKRRSNMRKIGQ